MMKKISYSISKHKNLGEDVDGEYVLWKEVKSEHGYGAKGICRGTRKECLQELKKRRSMKNDEDKEQV